MVLSSTSQPPHNNTESRSASSALRSVRVSLIGAAKDRVQVGFSATVRLEITMGRRSPIQAELSDITSRLWPLIRL